MAFNLLLSDDLKELTKGSFSAEFDPLLDNTIIPAVTASFAHYCNRPDFDLKVRTEYFSPKIHQDSIIVSSPPVAPLLTSLRTAALKWLLSVAGAGIYYVQLVGNGSASLADPTTVLENGVELNRKLTVALAAGEFYYGDADNLGFNTVYVNLSDSSDPDSKALDYVQHSKLTARLWEDYCEPRTYQIELVNGTDFFIDESAGIISKRCCYFRYGRKTIKLQYSGGFLTNDGENVPEDLRFAAIMQTKILFDRREELSLSNRSLEGGSIGLLTPLTLPRSVTLLLDKYAVCGAG